MDESLYPKVAAPKGRGPRDRETLDLFTGEPAGPRPAPARPKMPKAQRALLEHILAMEGKAAVKRDDLASTPPSGVAAGSVHTVLKALYRARLIQYTMGAEVLPTEEARLWLRKEREAEKRPAEPAEKALDVRPDPETVDAFAPPAWVMNRIRLLARKYESLSAVDFFQDLGRQPKDAEEVALVQDSFSVAAQRGWLRKMASGHGKIRTRQGEVEHHHTVPVYKSLIREAR